MKVVLSDEQIQYILKYRKISINDKIYKFDRKKMIYFRKLVIESNIIKSMKNNV